jgi:hypothetical protein
MADASEWCGAPPTAEPDRHKIGPDSAYPRVTRLMPANAPVVT